MSTILQPGDKIHLTIPVGDLYDEDAKEAGQRVYDLLAPMYALLGVRIAIWTTHGGVGAPAVAAVFRDPPTPAVVPAGQHETEEQ